MSLRVDTSALLHFFSAFHMFYPGAPAQLSLTWLFIQSLDPADPAIIALVAVDVSAH